MFLSFKNPSYIGVYDNTLTKDQCSRLIELFELSDHKVSGRIGNQLSEFPVENTKVKKTVEIEGLRFDDDTEISKIIVNNLTETISKYYRKYFDSLSNIDSWVLEYNYNFQKYETEDCGYKDWHTEHGSSSYTLRRVMAWSIYLNDAKSGTEFVNYSTIKAKAGRCVIWPASWTHTHRSQKNKGIKYLTTGWISFAY